MAKNLRDISLISQILLLNVPFVPVSLEVQTYYYKLYSQKKFLNPTNLRNVSYLSHVLASFIHFFSAILWT